MPIVIPPDGEISREEFEIIRRANAIELREKQRSYAKAIQQYNSDIDKK
jgi:GMP synthase PP-ATPase subunit